ncbi:MAG: ABC transporter permease [Burkholderiales bacterium]|nr:ABC transporter permease [Burkholderiales bacterium]
MLDGLTLQRRQHPSRRLTFGSYAGGLAAGLGLSAVLLLIAGVPPDSMVDDLFTQVFVDPGGLAQTVTLAIPLVLVGLSSAIAMRIRFWNIGMEGQLWLGAIGAAGCAIHDIGAAPLRLPLMLLAAAASGALWIAIPLVLRLRLRVSEMVVSLLLSSIAFLLLQHLLFGGWRDPANSFPVSPPFDPVEQLGLLGFGNVHTGLILAVAAVVFTAILVDRTRLGFQATAIGLNPLAARAAGLPVAATTIAMVLLSGALSGLAGGVIVAGTEHRLTQFIGMNATFSGIVIAFVARFKPAGVLVAAFAVAGIYNAGNTLKVFYALSDGIVVLIQSVVLLSLLVAQFFAAYRIDRVRGVTA